MTDVARAANCSQSTVSFVLNDNMAVQISEETRERVKRVARELGYVGAPSEHQAPMAGRKTGVIGMVIDSLSTSPEAMMTAMQSIRQALAKEDAIVFATETQNDPRLEPRAIEALLAQNVDAMIYACVHTRDVALPSELSATSTPVVLLNCYTKDGTRPAVVPDETMGGFQATQALIDAGHRRIATITGEPYMEATADRLNGYHLALKKGDLAVDPMLVVEGDWSASAGFRATMQLLKLDQPPTAIFCQNDRMAIGCYEALKERGVSIPGGMSVIGYDDDEISRHLFPPLSTVVLPYNAMGIWAVDCLLKDGLGGIGSYQTAVLECPLVKRSSIAPPAHRARSKKTNR